MKLKGLSYNIYWGQNFQNFEHLISIIPNEIDFLFLQEFPKKWLNSAKMKFGETRIKFVINAHLISFSGIGTKDYGNLTVLLTKKLKPKDWLRLNLTGSILDNLVFRGKVKPAAIITSLELHRLKFSVTNVHLSCLSMRKKVFQELSNIIDQIDEKKPSLIVGDMNYPSIFFDTKHLFNFMKSKGYKTIDEKNMPTYEFKFGPVGWKSQVDYLFVRNAEITKLETLKNVTYSDHLPILFEVGI